MDDIIEKLKLVNYES